MTVENKEDRYSEPEDYRELLDAAEEVCRCTRLNSTLGPAIVCADSKLDRLKAAVKAIRPFYHLEGGEKTR